MSILLTQHSIYSAKEAMETAALEVHNRIDEISLGNGIYRIDTELAEEMVRQKMSILSRDRKSLKAVKEFKVDVRKENGRVGIDCNAKVLTDFGDTHAITLSTEFLIDPGMEVVND